MIPSDTPASSRPTEPTTDADQAVAALVESVRSLRFVLNLTLVVLILVTTMLNFVLLYQLRSLRREAGTMLTNARAMAKVVDDFETNTMPIVERFSIDLRKFAERNADFAQVLAPYRFEGSTTNAASAPPNPAPRNTPPPKK